jgi:hypothetical protein
LFIESFWYIVTTYFFNPTNLDAPQSREFICGIGVSKHALSTAILNRSRQRARNLSCLLGVGGLTLLLWLRRRGFEGLLEVCNDVVDVLCTNGDADEVL